MVQFDKLRVYSENWYILPSLGVDMVFSLN